MHCSLIQAPFAMASECYKIGKSFRDLPYSFQKHEAFFIFECWLQ